MDLALEQVGSHFEYPSLRLVLHSGDWIPLSLPEKIKRHFPIAEVVSLGGQQKHRFGQFIIRSNRWNHIGIVFHTGCPWQTKRIMC